MYCASIVQETMYHLQTKALHNHITHGRGCKTTVHTHVYDDPETKTFLHNTLTIAASNVQHKQKTNSIFS